MKITPIEIRQKVFAEKMLRGYDKDEVIAFLQSLSQEWERVLEENREYRIKLEVTQKEVQKMRDVETSLYKTLKTAEDTSSQLIEQANRSADLQMREARNQADLLLNEARAKAQKMIQDAENQSRNKLEETLTELKSRENDFRQLERLKESLIKEIQNIASDTLDRINRVAEKGNKNVFEDKIREVREALENKPKESTISLSQNTWDTATKNGEPESVATGKPAETKASSTPISILQGSVVVKNQSKPATEKKEDSSPSKGPASFFDEIK
ncbi:DivIVA domain-containing protein [Cytophagaceae bacterium DM2B3-1]|uniref:DivIVA domain-containing protein n=1 Tax=Xanthocytophaga flava TaxID=3048013 RepID=A0AAE3QI59_9BACT|nr:DivIVA domain-containing protein [Xanthocytophaga flavus]MDJ1467701.1 DivIVA domain-containing protein [Xanthocytophaga flavus]MDJ1479802.1 DivIVA domain-containing protein [Xanthocytophaga flavus]MDJ1493781.1 DivIVA domain-containing protein [Xanthocytophaga flavus]